MHQSNSSPFCQIDVGKDVLACDFILIGHDRVCCLHGKFRDGNETKIAMYEECKIC